MLFTQEVHWCRQKKKLLNLSISQHSNKKLYLKLNINHALYDAQQCYKQNTKISGPPFCGVWRPTVFLSFQVHFLQRVATKSEQYHRLGGILELNSVSLFHYIYAVIILNSPWIVAAFFYMHIVMHLFVHICCYPSFVYLLNQHCKVRHFECRPKFLVFISLKLLLLYSPHI